jgi:hypothetical protein
MRAESIKLYVDINRYNGYNNGRKRRLSLSDDSNVSGIQDNRFGDFVDRVQADNVGIQQINVDSVDL